MKSVIKVCMMCLLTHLWIRTANSLAGVSHDILGRYHLDTGDINLGYIESLSKPKLLEGVCGSDIIGFHYFHLIETLTFAIYQINKNSTLLPGIKLGYVILDDCNMESLSLLRSSFFVPVQNDCQDHSKNWSLHDHFDVIGMICCSWSSASELVALTLAPYSIPIISFYSSAISLSDRDRFPTFSRLVASDSYQTTGMLEFVKSQGWQHISVVYSDLTYGVSAYEHIVGLSPSFNICIGAAIPMKIGFDYDFCLSVVRTLLYSHSARVVIIFGYHVSVQCLLTAVRAHNAQKKLVLIGSDTWASLFTLRSDDISFPPGIFVFAFQDANVPGLREFMVTIGHSHGTNPWLDRYLAERGCADKLCNIGEHLVSKNIAMATAILYDAVYTFAHALDKLIRYKCVGVSRNNLKKCLCRHKDTLLRFIESTQFEGSTGRVSFDETGSRLTKYKILQAQRAEDGHILPRLVGMYDMKSYHLVQLEFDLWSDFDGQLRPESSCVKPCLPGRIRITFGCCWVCRPCQANEITIDNHTKCEACPTSWRPDDTFSHCVQMRDKYTMLLSNTVSVILGLGLVTIGMVGTLCILAAYIIDRNHFVIRSASYELCILQIVSIAIGYTTVAALLLKTSKAVCTGAFKLLFLSFNTLFAAAALKAMRLHKLLVRYPRPPKTLRFITTRSQLVLMGVIILIQVVLDGLQDWLSPVELELQLYQVYREVFCHFPDLRVTFFLTTNLSLLMLCLYFSSRTRVLPLLYEENKYVTCCAALVILTWLAFMPAFQTLQHSSTQTLLLCLVVVLNLMTAQLLFFIFRLYLVYTRETTDLQQLFLVDYGASESIWHEPR